MLAVVFVVSDKKPESLVTLSVKIAIKLAQQVNNFVDQLVQCVSCRNVQAVELLLHFQASTCNPIYTSSGRYMAPVDKALRLMAEEDCAGSGILTALLQVGRMI